MLVVSSGGGGDAGAGMMVEVGDPRVKAQELLSAFLMLEPLLLSFLPPCGSMFLFKNVVAAGCRDHLLVVDIN